MAGIGILDLREMSSDLCPDGSAREEVINMKGVPEVLDKMADAVLAYRPKPKSKAAKKRRRKAVKKAKG